MPEPANATGDSSRLWLLVCLALLIIRVLIAAAEAALLNVSESKLRHAAEEGDQTSARLLSLLNEPDRTAATLHIAGELTTLCNAVLIALWSVEHLLPVLVMWWPAADRTALGFLTGLAVTLVAALLLTVVGELVPARVGAHRPEAVLRSTRGFWRVISLLFYPAAVVYTALARLLARPFGVSAEQVDTVTEEDILELMDAGEETGAIEGTQKDLVENIFAFDDTAVEELMTPRTDVEALDVTDTVEDALRIVMEEGFSRIPLYKEDIDHIIGVLYAKDLLRYVGQPLPAELSLRELSHDTYFIPLTKRCGELFAEMTEKHLQMAVVLDEYGGVAGIVTMEDLLEFIFGNIQDEYDDEEEEVRVTGDDCVEVDGAMNIEELCERWDIEPPKGDFDTVAGFILNEIDRIPAPDEHPQVTYDRLTLTVLAVDDRRIDTVQVHIAPPSETDA